MPELAFKKLDIDNWLTPDPTSAQFWAIVDGQPRVMGGEDWLKLILRPHFAEGVPLEIRRLYEIARGALAYGFLFYPLYTLAGWQLFRVAETAVSLKCKALRAPRRAGDLYKKVEWLAEEGIISSTEKHRWHKVRRSRNFTSYPESQSILPPGRMINFLQ